MLRPDQKERLLALGEEQLAIAEKWEREKEERDVHLQAMIKASEKNDWEGYQTALDNCLAVDQNNGRCEHDRSIWSSCAGCEEIEMALSPEFFDENGDRLEDDVIEAIINSNPERYGLPRS